MSSNYKYIKHNQNALSFEASPLDELEDMDASPANNQLSQPYIISLTNNRSADSSNVVILGANQNLAPDVLNFGNPAITMPAIDYNTTVSMGIGTVTYGMFLYQTITQPFTCCQLYLQSTTVSQIITPLTIQHIDSDGRLCKDPIVPLLDPYQNQGSVIITKDCFSVDGNTMITLQTLYASATVSIYIFPGSKINMRNNLLGKNTETNYAPTQIVQGQTLMIK